jgi:hypothetical protein
MPQLSLYIDDDTMEMLRDGAKAEGVSLSRYAADAIVERHSGAARRDEWPAGYWESVYGCLDDPTFVAPEDPLIDYEQLNKKVDFGF